MVPRLKEKYDSEIAPALKEAVGVENVHQIPKIEKIVINMGVGSAVGEKKHLEDSVQAMTLISGQKPIITKARKSIANFRLREGYGIGCKVTLRRARMYEFLDRLISIALPRVRDFRGISRTAFDGNGNYSLGLTEYTVFPELNPDKFTRIQGMNICIVTTATSNDAGLELLTRFGLPFKAADDVEQN